MGFLLRLLLWCLLFAYINFHTDSTFATGEVLGHRLVHRQRTGHYLGEYDIQDLTYRRLSHTPLDLIEGE